MAATNFEPMSIGQVLDGTFRIYKSNFVRFIAIVAIIHVPIGLIQIVSQSLILSGAMSGTQEATPMVAPSDAAGIEGFQESAGGELPAYGESDPYGNGSSGMNIGLVIGGVVGAIIAGLAFIFGTILCQAALTKSISEHYLGNDISVGEAYKSVTPKIWTLMGAGILVSLSVFGGMLLLIVPGIIFSLWFALTTPAIIAENTKAKEGMKRSRELARGNLGKIFSVLFLTSIISGIIGMIISVPVSLLSGVVQATQGMGVLSTVVSQIGSMSGNIIAAPIGAAAAILLYYDLRIRKEGFDLEMLANEIGDEQVNVETEPFVQ
jgi:hypothetical protein